MFRRCGEGFRKSGEPKLRNSDVPAMRRGFPKIWRAKVTKFRCSGDAERVSENLESRSSEIPMFRRCGEGLGKSSEPKLRNSHVPAMRRGYPKFLRPRKYEMLSKEIGNSEQRNRKENAWSPKATKFRRYDVPKMRRPGQCPSSATVLFRGIQVQT